MEPIELIEGHEGVDFLGPWIALCSSLFGELWGKWGAVVHGRGSTR
jgi:hypothetical protein